MPAKSFIGEVETAARSFYATVLRGEVSDANVRGYLRAASQIEDIWQETDARIAALQASGTPPWQAYAALRLPLAFIRAARTYQVFVRELLAADAANDPATAGFLPRNTYDQANALCHQIQPALQQAVASLHDPNYTPESALPLALGPRIESDDVCAVAHLQGMISAAREVREWAAGLLAVYENATSAATVTVPPDVTAHIAALRSRLAQGDSALRFGTDLVGQATQGEATNELHEQAEDQLWRALGQFFLLNQAVAYPELLRAVPVAPPAPSQAPRRYRDRPIRAEELWRIAAPSTRAELRGTEFGSDEMREMRQKMGGILSAGAQQYLDTTEAALTRGDIAIVGAMANCPFEPLYRARRPLEIGGAQIPAGHEFHWNFHRGYVEASPRFTRAESWQECED